MRGGWLALALLACGCSLDDIPFRCAEDSECDKGGQTGVCETNGYCSFADSSCDGTGRRYGDAAPKSVAGQCVPECVVQLSLGGLHSCARLADGSLRCWGAGLDGQLGNELTTVESAPTPVRVASQVEPAIELSAGDTHTCSVREDGRVLCWGSNLQFQLGVPINATGPIEIPYGPPSVTAVQVAAGYQHTCARGGDGVACWGANGQGQLGAGTTSEKELPLGLQLQLDVLELAAGGAHTCGRPSVGSLRCWGNNQLGQVGATALKDPVVSPFDTKVPASAVALGAFHTCVISAGAVRCWGLNAASQLGVDKPAGGPKPELVPLDAEPEAICAGYSHTCAALVDGRVSCWGDNVHGQLGPAATTKSSLPTTFSLPSPARDVECGGQHTCALTDSGRVYCWGRNDLGQLSNGSTDDTPTPDPAVTRALCL